MENQYNDIYDNNYYNYLYDYYESSDINSE